MKRAATPVFFRLPASHGRPAGKARSPSQQCVAAWARGIQCAVGEPRLRADAVRFVPGAQADHLTSHGGDLLGTAQMRSLRWLAAGATASYGAVSEPCKHRQKFPHPVLLPRHYLTGDSVIEACWNAWPGRSRGCSSGSRWPRRAAAMRVRPGVKFPCGINMLSPYLIWRGWVLCFVILLSNFVFRIVSSNKMPISIDNTCFAPIF